MDSENIKEKLKQYLYYVLIAILSLCSLIVFPIVGAGVFDVDLKTLFPSTTLGWILWIIVRILIIALNLIIFSNFIQQSKVNIKDDKNFIEANKILGIIKSKEYKPRNAKEFLNHQYSTKGVGLSIGTMASLFTIGSAAINYDYMLLLATAFTIILSIVFGIMTMKKCEIYYTGEYLDNAKWQEEQQKINNNEKVEKGDIERCLQLMEKNIEIYRNK